MGPHCRVGPDWLTRPSARAVFRYRASSAGRSNKAAENQDAARLYSGFMGDSMSKDQIATKSPTMTEEMQRGIAEIGYTDPELGKILQSFGEKIAAHTEAELPETKPPAKVIQLPLWAENRRAAPNAVFRSALFPALKFKERRPFLQEQAIPAVAGIEVSFTGQRFDQSDLD